MFATLLQTRVALTGRPGIICAAVLLLHACALEPEPSRREVHAEALENARIPSTWSALESVQRAVEPDWLAKLANPRLRAFVAEGLAYNSDLRAAAARVEQANAYVKVAGGQLYPAITAIGRAGQHFSSDGSGLEGIIVGASWELDVWGRVRYGVRASQDQLAASQADYAYARQSLVASIVKSWFLATEALLERDIAVQTVTAAADLLKLAESRSSVGIGSDLDVASAAVSLQNYRASLVQIELALEQALRALELLLGRYPAADISPSDTFPVLAPNVPTGIPSDLLERRPDVVAAERRVGAAFNLVQQARAARLPSLSLTASGSAISSDLFVLKDRSNPVWGLGGKVFAPLFTGGALKAQVAVATAVQQQAMAAYTQTALKAFDDVEGALSSESALQAREFVLTDAVADADHAARLAQLRYQIGAVDFRYVQQEQLAYQLSRMSLLQVQAERCIQRVNLYLALGGDFEAPT